MSGLQSGIATIALADPENRLVVFRNVAREAAGFAREAGIELVDVVDRLQDAAISNGLIEQHGQDAVQAALSEAIRTPITSENFASFIPSAPTGAFDRNEPPAQIAAINVADFLSREFPVRKTMLTPWLLVLRSQNHSLH